MGFRNIDTTTKSKAIELSRSHWKPSAIAEKSHCHIRTAYRWEQRLHMYGTPNLPKVLKTGRPRRLHKAARDSLIEYLQQHPWSYQDELSMFLEEEWSLTVSQPTISRLLKEHRISQKKGQRVGHTQSRQLRVAWQASMLDFTAEQLIFVDESIFKQQTGWRSMAYGPIGEAVRYSDDMTRGDTWSICPAYTVDGYLPCTAIRQGYFNSNAFFSWFANELLPLCRPFPEPRSVICLDNLNVHLDPRIKQAAEEKGVFLKFLPPYSPDYSPIELTFSMLKAWMRRHIRDLRYVFQGRFGDFLKYAVEQSGCDRTAKEHFRHSAGGYMFEGDYEAFQKELEEWSREQQEEA